MTYRTVPFATGETPGLRASIIIVNYNGKHFLHDCLTSVELQTVPPEQWEVVLVDNGSTDGSGVFVRQRFPWVRLIEARRNLGFAGGNNKGMRHARGPNLVLLNNDTVVDPHWLEGLLTELDAGERVGGVGSKIVFKHAPRVINTTGLQLYDDGRGGDRGFLQVDRGQFAESAEVFGACGASVLLRRSMLEDVGAFDERFFMYYEDLDLAWRARLRGWQFRYTPRSVVYHVHCGTSGEGSPFFLYHNEKNRVFVNLKNGSLSLALRSLAVFHAKALRKWWRVLTAQECSRRDWGQAFAYARAAGAIYWNLPLMLWRRFLVRGKRRLVPDESFAHLVVPSPKDIDPE
jgi:GT2 family glycosyltransferase